MSKYVLFLFYIAFGNTVLEKSLSVTVQLQKYYFPRKDRLCPSLSSPLPASPIRIVALLNQTVGKWGQNRCWKVPPCLYSAALKKVNEFSGLWYGQLLDLYFILKQVYSLINLNWTIHLSLFRRKKKHSMFYSKGIKCFTAYAQNIPPPINWATLPLSTLK